MDLKKELPKLGKDADWKRNDRTGVELGPEEDVLYQTARPDYKNFKTKKYNSENSCAGVLVGLPSPNRVHVHYDEILRSIHEKSTSLISFEFIIRIQCLFTEIKEVIEVGIQSDEIRVVNINPIYKQKGPFSLSRNLHTKDFLNWMKTNGFPIPDELQNMSVETFPSVDYSGWSKKELGALAKRLQDSGMTKWQIAQRLYHNEIETMAKSTLEQRVKRLLHP